MEIMVLYISNMTDRHSDLPRNAAQNTIYIASVYIGSIYIFTLGGEEEQLLEQMRVWMDKWMDECSDSELNSLTSCDLTWAAL